MALARAPAFDSEVERFSAYTRRLEQYFVANDLGASERVKRRAVFLSAIGPVTFALLEDLIAPTSVTDSKYEDLVKVLTEHFEPSPSRILARYRFHTYDREDGTSVTAYVAALRRLARPCQFTAEMLDEMLRDRLVCGVRNSRLQSRLLSEPSLTLSSALAIAQAFESAAANASELNRGGPASSERADPQSVHRVEEQRQRQRQRQPRGAAAGGARASCWRCLKTGHGPADCPFRSRRCYSCGELGHLRAACRRRTPAVRAVQAEAAGYSAPSASGAAEEAPESPGLALGGSAEEDVYALFGVYDAGDAPLPAVADGRPLSAAADGSEDTADLGGAESDAVVSGAGAATSPAVGGSVMPEVGVRDSGSAGTADTGGATSSTGDGGDVSGGGGLYRMEGAAAATTRRAQRSRPPYTVPVRLSGRALEMELDTGAAVSVCSERAFKKLWPSDGPPLEPCGQTLKTYSGEPLSVRGQVMVDVQYGDVSVRLPLVIVGGDGPCLFGRDWLARIKLDWSSVCVMTASSHVDAVLAEFPDVFSGELGCFRGEPVTVEVDPDVRPRFFKPRIVPLAYRQQVEQELDRQVEQGLWEPVTHSKWAAPLVVVPKAGGKDVRLCGDYRLTVNKAAKADQYPLPRIEDLLSKMCGGKVFSKCDLKSAYNQLVLEKESRQFLTINTHRGLLRPTRLSFGYSAAPSLFQRTIETLLAGIDGVGVFLDDVVITGRDMQEHNIALREVLRRLSDAGLRVNRDKCSFGVPSVQYLGFKVSERGVETTEDKVSAIRSAPDPQNVSQLRSWLGLINYYGKFLPNLASVLSPLHRLLRRDVQWVWSDSEKRAFQTAKDMLLEPAVLAHFDPSLPVVLVCDASPVGIGCILSQVHRDGERPVAFYSRSLNSTEARYSQTDREGLAVVSGVKKFNYFLAGRPFVIRTDHKPLLGLIGEQKSLPVMASPRVMRWAMLLAGYDYRLQHVAGSKIPHCDALSRLPVPCQSSESPCPVEFVNLLEFLNSSPVTADQIRKWTTRDPTLSRVYQFVQSGWPDSDRALAEEFRPYKARIGELSLQDGCVMWGSRVVIPPQGRKSILDLLHEGHSGESRSKSFARMYVWWPGMDGQITETVQKCHACQSQRNREPDAPLHPWVWPAAPWERVHIDFCGPMNGYMFLIVIDAFSKWMEVFPMRSATAEATIEMLRVVFARWGLPKTIVSDNAQCFVCPAFQTFCGANGVKHITTPPYSPKSNGLAEKSVQTFKNGFAKQKTGSVLAKVSRFLFKYRATPHSTTMRSPAELFLGRQFRTHLDTLRPDLRDRVERRQWEQKCSADRGAKERHCMPGDAVYVSAVDRLSGVEGRMRWLPAVVVSRKNTEVVVRLFNGSVLRRHVDCVRKRRSVTEVCDDFVELSPRVVPAEPLAAVPCAVPDRDRRSDRPRRSPRRLRYEGSFTQISVVEECGRPRPSQSRRRGAGDRSRAARPDPALYCDRLWPGARDDVSVCADRVRAAK